MKRAGAKTTFLSPEGIETENGLSTLVDLPEMEGVFGENLAFELKALFCDPLGPNLRNELAHGLLDGDIGNTAPAVYAWWLVFRVVFLSYWNQRLARKAATDGADANPDGTESQPT